MNNADSSLQEKYFITFDLDNRQMGIALAESSERMGFQGAYDLPGTTPEQKESARWVQRKSNPYPARPYKSEAGIVYSSLVNFPFLPPSVRTSFQYMC